MTSQECLAVGEMMILNSGMLSSKMLTTFILSMRATPYYYYGDEIGMNNIKFDKIEDYRDIATA